MILATAALCLAANIYHEARGEPVPGQYAVALVTMNRADQQKDQVCKEVFRRRQFSWTSQVRKTPQGWKLPARMVPKDDYAWWMAKRVASATLQGQMRDITRGATYYHAVYVSPGWRTAFEPTRRLGQHVFYRVPTNKS